MDSYYNTTLDISSSALILLDVSTRKGPKIIKMFGGSMGIES